MSANYEGIDVYVTRGELPNSVDAMIILTEAGVVDPVTNENGEILISEDGNVFIL